MLYVSEGIKDESWAIDLYSNGFCSVNKHPFKFPISVPVGVLVVTYHACVDDRQWIELFLLIVWFGVHASHLHEMLFWNL